MSLPSLYFFIFSLFFIFHDIGLLDFFLFLDLYPRLQKTQSGGTLPAPIVLMQNNEPYLVGGNTRLMVSRAMGVQPMILKVVLN